MTDTAPRGPGRPRKIDLSLMAMWALLLVRIHGADRKPAVKAAILAWFTWTEHKHPDRQVDICMERVLKALQRLESGRTNVHPALIDAVGWRDKATNAPVFGTPQELAQSVARFLPSK